MIIKNLVAYLRHLPEDIVGIEARHVVFCPRAPGTQNDYHLVKEVVHYRDGRVEPRTVLIENYERPFYVTKTGHQNHLEKKEWEHEDKLTRYMVTESRLHQQIAVVVDNMRMNPNKGFANYKDVPTTTSTEKGLAPLRQILRNPYIYGADVKATTLIKRTYQMRFPDLTTPSTVALFDIETDVTGVRKGKFDPMTMATLSFGSKVVTAVDKRYLEGIPNAKAELHRLFAHYMDDDVRERKINWQLYIVDGPINILRCIFEHAHKWKPDFVAIWNIKFEMENINDMCKKAGINPADILSDPSLKKPYRHYEWIEGREAFVTSSGKRKPLKWVEKWHWVETPASFILVDQACAYKRIRTGAESDEPSYALDAILKKHGKHGKLKFKEADHVEGLAWHKLMQTKYKLEYVIYNVFDCVRPETLDEVTNDLRLTMPMMAGSSGYRDFSSQPRCSADNLHFFVRTKKHVLGTTSDQMTHELDQHCVPLTGWICTLPAANIAMNGLKLLEDYPNRETNIRIHVGDLDVAASYPNGGAVFNTSKATTVRELARIDGVDFEDQRDQGINLSGGHTNAVEFMTVIAKAPQMDTFLDAFLQDEGITLEPLPPLEYPSTLRDDLIAT